MIRHLYSAAWWLLSPAAATMLWWRGRREPGYRQHWKERWAFGLPALKAIARGHRIWLHAVSLGETRAAIPLMEALLKRDPHAQVLLTHMTPTGRAAGAEWAARWPERVQQMYLPYDSISATQRFLRRVRPDIGLMMETEVWPNLMASAASTGVPMVLVNGRLSEKSLAKGLRFRALIEPAVRAFRMVIAQTQAHAVRMQALGAAHVVVAGNLKFDSEPDPAMLAQGRALKRMLRMPVLMGAATREGEEAGLMAGFAHAQSEARCLIVPRHPARADEIGELCARNGFAPPIRRSAYSSREAFVAAASAQGDAILIGDSMGEMPFYYGLSDCALLGGSFQPLGGQNLIEAIACACPVIAGPHTFNFEQAADDAARAGALLRVPDEACAMRKALDLILNAPEPLAQMRAHGAQWLSGHRGALARHLEYLQPLLSEIQATAKRG